MKLENAGEVMKAFLAGSKLKNRYYGDGINTWLYLENDCICEEDGAGAKAHRMNYFDFRGEDPEWETID